jgi:DNA-binding transcriptional regulator GbsR (MarR family)
MSKILEELEKELTEKYVRLSEFYGIEPTIMRVYLTLFLSTKPLGLKEISEKTGYSVSTICNAMEIVERIMDVRSFKKPGSKRIYYECQHDIFLVQQKKLHEAHKQMHSMIEVLTESEKRLEGETELDAIRVKGYLSRAREDFEKLDSMVSNLKSMFE